MQRIGGTSISDPFIKRPVGTTLLSIALFLIGALAYFFLPVTSLPALDLPTISIAAARPGADPETMAATVAAPLERKLAHISGLKELTSTSSLGLTQITAQFYLDRNIDAAARDIRAAINAANADLPTDLVTQPTFRKANSAASPILLLAVTSDSMSTSAIFDAADTVIAQRISQVAGVGGALIVGADQPAIRIQVDPARLASMGLGLDRVANAVSDANSYSPLGAFGGDGQSVTIATTDQLNTPEDYRGIVVASKNGAVVKLGDVATVDRGVRNRLAAGWYNGKPAIILAIFKQPGANVIQIIDNVRALLPKLRQWIPQDLTISVLADRTQTIRSSVAETQRTLIISICLVMAVVFLFLRRVWAVAAAGVAVPLSLAGSCAALWVGGYSIDNLSLTALTISVGFVVDDAIVMIENIEIHFERGMSRMAAARLGARQIAFTVVSISLSLIAVFIPLPFMPGVTGKLLQEFSYTLTFAIIISAIVALTVTPMLCAWLPASLDKTPSALARIFDRGLAKVIDLYGRSLLEVVDRPWLTLVIIVGTIGWTTHLYKTIHKDTIPQDDTGLISGTVEASPDVSFAEMERRQKLVTDALAEDSDVADIASFIGSTTAAPSNQGQLYVALKPPSERHSSSLEVIERLRPKFARIPGADVYLMPAQELRSGGRKSKSAYQFALSDSSQSELDEWVPKILERLRRLPQLADVSTDRQQGGLKAAVMIDRVAASRMRVSVATLDAVLNSAFGQREDSIIYTERNNYRVVIEVPQSRRRDIGDLSGIYITNADGRQIPLTALARIERGAAPLVVCHQGVMPTVTITFNPAPRASLEEAAAAVDEAVGGMILPSGLHTGFVGEAADFRKSVNDMTLAIVGALLAIYIILGVLYESYILPITILSTLPSAGLGALLSLEAFHMEFTVPAFMGVLLLIGIVKKNGIMFVDFALQAEREGGLSVRDLALEAASERFRPIMMTTFAAMFGAFSLVFATGVGAELRRPLGITIVGGLLFSQVLTLYTTPVIYLLMSKLRNKRNVTPSANLIEKVDGLFR